MIKKLYIFFIQNISFTAQNIVGRMNNLCFVEKKIALKKNMNIHIERRIL